MPLPLSRSEGRRRSQDGHRGSPSRAGFRPSSRRQHMTAGADHGPRVSACVKPQHVLAVICVLLTPIDRSLHSALGGRSMAVWTDNACRVSEHFHRGAVVVAVSGAVDAVNAPRLAESLRRRLTGMGDRTVVDLTDVGFIDSSGLRVLLESLRTYQAVRADLWLVVPDPKIGRLLEITGLDQVFHVFPSLEAATL